MVIDVPLGSQIEKLRFLVSSLEKEAEGAGCVNRSRTLVRDA